MFELCDPRFHFHFPLLDDESSTSANLGNDHVFIIKEYSLHWYEAYSLHWYEAFWRIPKQSHENVVRAYAQSGQYYTIVESRVRLTSFFIAPPPSNVPCSKLGAMKL